jgi:hypothetical protein
MKAIRDESDSRFEIKSGAKLKKQKRHGWHGFHGIKLTTFMIERVLANQWHPWRFAFDTGGKRNHERFG